MSQERLVVGGIYRHFKGGKYIAICKAKDSETQKEVVVYIGRTGIWIRLIENFLESVEVDLVVVPRFRLIGRSWARYPLHFLLKLFRI